MLLSSKKQTNKDQLKYQFLTNIAFDRGYRVCKVLESMFVSKYNDCLVCRIL